MAGKPSKLSGLAHIFKAVAPNLLKVAMSTNPITAALEPTVTALLASKLSKPDAQVSPTIEAVTAALSAPGPDELAAVKAADDAFTEKMGQLGVDLGTLDVQDRASARSLAATLRSALPYWAGTGLIVVCLSMEFWILMHGLPTGLDPVITGRILGTLDALATMAATYIWGSSGGSQGKDEAIGEALKNATK